ncbi:hypothetical protein FIBSPDRAFT_968475 [Athelia psychrophila]|uniref:Uncharacterized protein n=1 Tax=Athelia psychrophila TaxID=1759441 RepID=A0A167UK63_9AGAM|nr:hypothetical protein FIBSPDRAFT_968475 [Fibularhizoctonia sp. CBS 109695]
MGLLKKSEEIVPMLKRVTTWLEENTVEDQSLKDLVIEAIDFASKFAADITGPATLCLQRMNAGLKCNMYNTTLSAHLTTEVLPEELVCACQFWVDHICNNGIFESTMMTTLVAFLRTHLLHWFEAMSLMKKSEEIAPMLHRVAIWLEDNIFEDKSLKNLVIEAIDLARKFAADITEYPLYIYYVALMEGRNVYSNGLLAISLQTPPDMASQSIANGINALNHFVRVRITDEAAKAQQLALVLERQLNTAMTDVEGCINGGDSLLAILFPTPDMAVRTIVNILDKLSHFMRIADEVSTVWFPPRKYRRYLRLSAYFMPRFTRMQR